MDLAIDSFLGNLSEDFFTTNQFLEFCREHDFAVSKSEAVAGLDDHPDTVNQGGDNWEVLPEELG